MSKSIEEQLKEKGFVPSASEVPPPPPAPVVPPIRPGTRLARRKPLEEEPLPFDVPPPEEERPLVNLKEIRTAQMLRIEDLEKRLELVEMILDKEHLAVRPSRQEPLLLPPPPLPPSPPPPSSSSDVSNTFDLSDIESRLEHLERENREMHTLKKRMADLERVCTFLITEGRSGRNEVITAILAGKHIRPVFQNEKGKLSISVEVKG